MIREGGEIVVYVFNKSDAQIKADDLAFCDGALPDRDRSTMYFFGSWVDGIAAALLPAGVDLSSRAVRSRAAC